jgi:hypothetical protein
MPSNLVDVGQTLDLALYRSSPDKGLLNMHSVCLPTGWINHSDIITNQTNSRLTTLAYDIAAGVLVL